MGSMAPTVGGQYHWVSEFAPRDYQKSISYLMGWLCVLGWQVGCTSGAYLVGTQIQGLIVLNNPDYVYERWHGTLLTMAVSAAAILFNTVRPCTHSEDSWGAHRALVIGIVMADVGFLHT